MGKTYISPSGLAKEVQKIYYGDENNLAQEISKVYVGDSNGVARLVFGNSAILPREYQQVEYIYNNKNLYINTGLTFTTASKIISRIQFINLQHSSIWYNGHSGDNYHAIYYGHNNNGFAISLTWGGKSSFGYMGVSKSGDDTNIHEFEIDAPNRYFRIDDQSNTNTYRTPNNAQNTFYLFSTSGSAGSSSYNYSCIQKLYTFKWYNNGTLTRSFYPCYRKSDNVVGLYEIFTNTFFPKTGGQSTAVLYAGPDYVGEL